MPNGGTSEGIEIGSYRTGAARSGVRRSNIKSPAYRSRLNVADRTVTAVPVLADLWIHCQQYPPGKSEVEVTAVMRTRELARDERIAAIPAPVRRPLELVREIDAITGIPRACS